MLWLVNWNLTSQDPLNTELMAEGWEHMENEKYQISTGRQQVSHTCTDLKTQFQIEGGSLMQGLTKLILTFSTSVT